MSEELDRRVLELFHELLALPESQRDSRLLELTAGQNELRERLADLMGADAESDAFLREPVLGEGFHLSRHYRGEGRFHEASESAREHHPETIGPYRIRGVLGHGGMGIVYRAEQQNPEREVALKILRPGFADARFRRHFEREARALARLKHPGIAQIYEAGTADLGRGPIPFLVMEFVEGRDLRVYAHEEQPDIRARVRLLIEICEAVQHAHKKSVVHRDLKPGNILVTGEGRAKVLDFGLARLTDEDKSRSARSSETGSIIGTLAYMSPEQLGSDAEAIDASTDVYALGATAFEWLADAPPYDLRGLSLTAALRRVTQEAPNELAQVAPELDRNLVAIVKKAMSKEAGERYATPVAMAEDLGNWLRDLPVKARAAGRVELLAKFARRNRAVVLGAAAFLLVSLLGVVSTLWQARSARREAVRANDIKNYLQEMLRSTGGVRTDGVEQSMQHVLAQAADGIDHSFHGDLRTRAEIADTIGMAYFENGYYARALTLLSRAHAWHQAILPEDDVDRLTTLNDLGVVEVGAGSFVDAERHLRQALAGRRRVLGDHHVDTMRSAHRLGQVLLQHEDPSQAGSLLEEAWSTFTSLLGEESLETMSCLKDLSIVWRREGQVERAIQALRQVLEVERQVCDEQDFELYHTLNDLATSLMDKGSTREAETLLTEALGGYRRLRGSEHPMTLVIEQNLSVTRGGTGSVLDEVLAESSAKRELGPETDGLAPGDEPAPVEAPQPETLEHPQYYALMISAATNKFYRGAIDEAEADLHAAIEGLERHSGQERYLHPARQCLASIFYERGQYDEAIQLQQRVIAEHRAAGTEESALCMMAKVGLASSLTESGHGEQALALLLEVSRALSEKTGADSLYALSARSNLATVYSKLGQWQRALECSSEAVTTATERFGLRSPFPHIFGLRLARILTALERYEEAEEVLLASHEALLELHTAAGPYTRRARQALVDLYLAWGRPDESERWRTDAGAEAAAAPK